MQIHYKNKTYAPYGRKEYLDIEATLLTFIENGELEEVKEESKPQGIKPKRFFEIIDEVHEESKPCNHAEGWKCDICMGEEGRQEIIKKQKDLGLLEESKPCLMEDDTLEAIKEYEEYQKSLREPYGESLAKMFIDHDKEKIPYLPEYEASPRDGYLLAEKDKQLELLTTSLNLIIKRLNNE